LAPKLGVLEYMALQNEAALTERAPSELQVTWRGGLDVRQLLGPGLSAQDVFDRYNAILDRP
jgi:hypothetical protein